MITTLLIFPCVAILWMLVLDRLGMVRDEALMDQHDGEAKLIRSAPKQELLKTQI